jgi:hypothetical protein
MNHRRIECIDKNPELWDYFNGLLTFRGWTRDDLSKHTGVGAGTIDRIFHPEEPGVSKKRFMIIAGVLPQTPEEKVQLLKYAGINIEESNLPGLFARMINERIERLDLNPANQGVLEKYILKQVEDVGSALKDAQLRQEQLEQSLIVPQPRGVKRLFSRVNQFFQSAQVPQFLKFPHKHSGA